MNYPTREFFQNTDMRGPLLFPVHYTATRYAHDWSKGRPSKASAPSALLAALHKSPEWAHEVEWRIVIADGKPTPGYELQMPKPASITLGARMTADERKAVVAIATARSIPLFDCRLSTDKFELVLSPSESLTTSTPDAL